MKMKIIFNSSLVIIFSVLFFACSDSPVTSGIDANAYYIWSAQPIPFDTVYQIYNFDEGDLILNASGLQKISEGAITRISVQDTSFNFQGFNAYNSNHYVYSGNKVSDPNTPVIKIYDNGVYRDYTLPRQSVLGIAFVSHFINKNKFYITLYPETKKYYLFQNGTFTEFELSEGSLQFFFKSADNVYAVGRSTSVSGYSYYKITDSGPVFLRAETYGSTSYSNTYYIANDVIRITSDSLKQKFSFFTEQGWSEFATYTVTSPEEYLTEVIGNTRNQFLVLKKNKDLNQISAIAWDGMSFWRQTNFPTGLTQNNYGYFLPSNYTVNTNTFYLYQNYGSRVLYRATLRGQ